MRRLLQYVFLLAVVGGHPAMASTADLVEQRVAYVRAMSALEQGNLSRYQSLAAGLRDYPLYPYLEYRRLQKNLKSLPNKEVREFLAAWPDSPLAERLHASWLHMLALRKQWKDLETHYDPKHRNTELTCYYLWARYQNGSVDAAFAGVPDLWAVGRSQPGACDDLFKVWIAAGRLTPELAWRRLELALQAGNRSLASYLLRYLPPDRKALAERYIEVHRKPDTVAQFDRFTEDTPEVREMVLHGIRRQRRCEPEVAIRWWEHYRDRLSFTAEERRKAEERLVLAMAAGYRADADRWLGTTDPNAVDADLVSWRVRLALKSGDWAAVMFWAERLATLLPEEPDWVYWQARAMLALDPGGESRRRAEKLLGSIADRRHFYGFLAADRVNRPYGFESRPVEVSAARARAMERQPGIRRALELYVLGEHSKARVEWTYATRDAPPEQMLAAAAVARDWAWHSQAIVSCIQAGYWDDLGLRFPVGWREYFVRYAKLNNIDTYWAYAVARQESALRPEARSHANARGLMQLIPSTARSVARRIGAPYKSGADLYEPELNIRLGTSYLGTLYRQYGVQAHASAAYNAGPSRVDRWLKDRPDLDLDAWIETIPYSETRQYVKNVLAFRMIYAFLEGRNIGGVFSP